MAWVFMDLEMKPVDRQFRRQWDICRQEVIEFGAVKLGADLSETDSFRKLVKPVYGDIPPRYERLTGISNEMVTEAADFATVLAEFASWCGDAETVYAWSGSDLDQLRGEVKMKGMDFPLEALAGKWADFQKIFTRAVGLKRELSPGAGGEHRQHRLHGPPARRPLGRPEHCGALSHLSGRGALQRRHRPPAGGGESQKADFLHPGGRPGRRP